MGGLKAVAALRKRFPNKVIASDQKIMDGGSLVMVKAHDVTIKGR
ncbi:MAG: hypothetical protein QW231_01620 [Candidatus Bathyarchaeia archaeon]